MNSTAPRRLSDIRSEFERGTFPGVNNSRMQGIHRIIARAIPGPKHGLRGTFFSWPLCLLPLAAWVSHATYLPLILLLLPPGVYVSGVILRPGYPGRLLFPGNLGL